MPAGGLIQLATANGEQDLYIIGNPQITFFTTVYRRHTNFSCETVNEIFGSSTGGSPADFGRLTECALPVRGDLISKLTLRVKLGSLNPSVDALLEEVDGLPHDPDHACSCKACLAEELEDELMFGWVNSLGHALVKSAWITIGGQKIEKQYGEWMEIWSELTQTNEKRNGYYQMIGKVDPTSYTATTFASDMELYIPLNFWFCKNYGLALPIIALYNQDVKLHVDFRKFDQLWVKNKSNVEFPGAVPVVPTFEASVLIEYIYLDLDERKQVYENSHMYLIEQVQFSYDQNASQIYNNIDLYFNHPTKEMIWVMQRNDVIGKPNGLYPGSYYPIGNDWFNFSMYKNRAICKVKDPYETAVLQFNGQNRFMPMPAKYFRLVQPYYRHTRNPLNYIYSYSFALKPEEHQPTGHANLSRIKKLRLLLKQYDKLSPSEIANYTARIYTVGYNVLAITEGMAGLLFYN